VIVWQTVRDDLVNTQPLATPWGEVAGDRALHNVVVSENYAGQRLSDVRKRVSDD
jgi:hypothetical protein